MKTLIKSGIDKDIIVDLIIKKGDPHFKLIHSKEFVYKSNMYDIISKYSIGEYTYYKCVNDTKEKELIKEFSHYISDFFGHDSSDIGLKIKYLLNQLHLEGIFNTELISFKHYFSKLKYHNFNEFFINFSPEIDIPPPKFLFPKNSLF